MILNKRGLFACALLINVVVDAYASSQLKNNQSNKNIQPINNFNVKPKISNTAKQKEIGDITQVRNELHQIYWRIQARSMRNNSEITKTKYKWIKQEDYKQSIENVIGKAIADRITNKNEFKDKGPGELITFDGPEYEDRPEDYTQENWNAVVLYNFINRLYWEYYYALNKYTKSSPESSPDMFFRDYFLTQISNMSTTLQADISSHYHNYQEKIKNAISEIIVYFRALCDMSTEFAHICKYALMYDSSDDPKSFVCPNFGIAEDKQAGTLTTKINLGSGDIPIQLNFKYNDKDSKFNWALNLEKLDEFFRSKAQNETPNSVLLKIFDLFDGLF